MFPSCRTQTDITTLMIINTNSNSNTDKLTASGLEEGRPISICRAEAPGLTKTGANSKCSEVFSIIVSCNINNVLMYYYVYIYIYIYIYVCM